jgi:hypothetical protein
MVKLKQHLHEAGEPCGSKINRTGRIEKKIMKKRTTDTAAAFRRLAIVFVILMLAVFQNQRAFAAPPSDGSNPVPAAAAMKLVQFCADPKIGLDSEAVATLVDYVLGSKPSRESGLPSYGKATGAYHEFDTRISFANFLKYSYSSQIPSVLTSPASLRYSQWTGKSQKLPGAWEQVSPNGKPVIIHGTERIGITPDLTTGVYYKYDVKKMLILLNHEGRQVLLSVAKQVNISDVGKKGFILGNDDDWNYYYSGETGSAMTGLGWVKAYIYDYFSVGVHAQSGSTVRSGVFQWIRAGWSGMNFVEKKHVINGMKRYARNSKTVLESPRLPAPNQIASTYQRLSALPQNVLVEKCSALQNARKQLAVRKNKVGTNEKLDSCVGISKEQIIEELMLEYFKNVLGKPALLRTTDL